jgi:hypothetical protein
MYPHLMLKGRMMVFRLSISARLSCAVSGGYARLSAMGRYRKN